MIVIHNVAQLMDHGQIGMNGQAVLVAMDLD